MDSATEKLERGLQRLATAGTNPDDLGQALLSLHGALEDYFRDWLEANNGVPLDERKQVQDGHLVQWPKLLDLMQDYGGLSDSHRHTIQRMNVLRIEIAHGGGFRGRRADLEEYAGLVKRLTGISVSPPMPTSPVTTPRHQPLSMPPPSLQTATAPRQATGTHAPPPVAVHRRPTPEWVRTLWNGRYGPTARWRTWLGMVVALSAVPILYTLALSALRWQMPLAIVGWVCVALALASLYFAGRAIVQIILQLGVKRLLVRLVIIYAAAVVVVALMLPTGQQGIGHWIASARKVLAWTGSGIGQLISSVIEAPDSLRFATTGQRDPIPVRGVTWVGGVPPTPLVVDLVPAANRGVPVRTPAPNPTSQPTRAPSDQPLRIGIRVRVVGTDGTSLRARERPSTDAGIVTLFPEGTELEIVDGPQKNGDREWWRVRRGESEGWCAAEYLVPIQGP